MRYEVDVVKLKELRERNKYTLKDIAEKMGKSCNYYYMKERRYRLFTLDDVFFLCNLYAIEINDIININI